MFHIKSFFSTGETNEIRRKKTIFSAFNHIRYTCPLKNYFEIVFREPPCVIIQHPLNRKGPIYNNSLMMNDSRRQVSRCPLRLSYAPRGYTRLRNNTIKPAQTNKTGNNANTNINILKIETNESFKVRNRRKCETNLRYGRPLNCRFFRVG